MSCGTPEVTSGLPPLLTPKTITMPRQPSRLRQACRRPAERHLSKMESPARSGACAASLRDTNFVKSRTRLILRVSPWVRSQSDPYMCRSVPGALANNGSASPTKHGSVVIPSPCRTATSCASPSVVLTGTSAGTTGAPAFSAYSASKAAVRNLARTWAEDLKGTGIRVNVLSPGAVATELAKEALGAEGLNVYGAMTALQRMGDPAEVGAAAAFLASSDSSFMTASEVAVDGGLAQL